jgi:SAM-dependent methyltransferase
MKTFVAPGPGEMGKFQGVVQAFAPSIWEGLILDVGCRSTNFKRLISSRAVRYYGIDLSPPADVMANVEDGLPFTESSFDVVVALDVLEHTDDIHKAISELFRVSRRFVVLLLPNGYELTARLKFLLGRPISGKYVLPVEAPSDRHRWLFSFNEAKGFIHGITQKYEFEVAEEGCLIGPRRGFAIGRLMASLFPNLLSPWYLVLLRKREAD